MSYTLQINSTSMGAGSQELGEMLLRSFLNNLAALEELPTSIVVYNAGVGLAQVGSDTAGALQKMADKGAEILLCGTCIDYYGLRDKALVGQVSNMATITDRLLKAPKVVSL